MNQRLHLGLAAAVLLTALALNGCGNDLDNFGNVRLSTTTTNSIGISPTASEYPANRLDGPSDRLQPIPLQAPAAPAPAAQGAAASQGR